MVNIALHGCDGKMCRRVFDLCESDFDVKVVAGVDKCGCGKGDIMEYPVFESVKEMFETVQDIDVVIDFSDASAVGELIECCKVYDVSAVICTTGLDQATLEQIKEASKTIPIIQSANMSIGVNMLLNKIGEFAEKLVSKGFDVEIVEKHHNQKLDAPSEIAVALADAAAKGAGYAEPGDCTYVYDRSTKHEKRGKHEIGISSVHGGTIVGEHDVISVFFTGEDEVITLSHQTFSKAVFAKGAIAAAKVMAEYHEKNFAGLFDMRDIVN